MGFAAQSQFCSAGSAAQGAADCWEMGKAASSPKRQHSHPRQFSVSLKLVHTAFEGRISKILDYNNKLFLKKTLCKE